MKMNGQRNGHECGLNQGLEASKVLEAALEQMDGIIAEVDQSLETETSPPSVRASLLFSELRTALEAFDPNDSLNNIDPQTKRTVLLWLMKATENQRQSDLNLRKEVPIFNNSQDRVQFMETERENLMLQVGILSEQVEAQSEKINDLEANLSELKMQLCESEALLQETMRSRTSLEGAKLDLLSEISKLRQRLVSGDEPNHQAEEAIRGLESDVSLLRTTLLEKETEIGSLRLTLAKLVRSTNYPLNDKDMHILRGRSSSCESVDRKRVNGQSRISEKPPPAPPRPSTSTSCHETRRDSTGSTGLTQSFLFSPNSPVYRVNKCVTRGRSASPMARANSAEHMEPGPDSLTSSSHKSHSLAGRHYSTIPRLHGAQVLQKIQQQLQQHELGQSNSLNAPLKYHPESRVHSDRSRPLSLSSQSSNSTNKFSVSFGKGFFWLKRGKRSASAPEIANDDEIISYSGRNSNSDLQKSAYSLPPGVHLTKEAKSKSSLKRIFGKIKRSGSSGHGFASNDFVRGGFRATSGPRLGHSVSERKIIEINLPFSRWDTNLVADWFGVIGLGMYATDCKRWVKNGEHLLRATSSEVEKELGLKVGLHRKKLRLALSVVCDNCDALTKAASKLDYLWIAKWLDDIGLPQYKDAFLDARVDGCVLHNLTIDDLLFLKVTLQLHYCSIRRGIQLLRDHRFDGQCIKRRAAPDEANINEWIPAEVASWSSHRVMEWFRSIDLSEYTPNMRGSGVHGALFIFEPSFSSDLLASLLSIPQNKTLLRRHITTHFKQLIGHEVVKQKRDFESQPTYAPLVLGAKIKAHRRNQFTLIKRRAKSDLDFEDYVCPMVPSRPPVSPEEPDDVFLGSNSSKQESQV